MIPINIHNSIASQIKYEFDFQFEDKPGIWLRADVTVEEAFNAIKTGLLKNNPVSKINLFAITDKDKSVGFIYDVAAAKQGNQPWSLQF